MSVLLDRARGECRLGRGVALLVILVGPVLAAVAGIGLGSRRLRPDAKWWLYGEGHPVEVLTFLFLLAGGLLALVLARRLARAGRARWIRVFYVVFGVAFLITACEEVAWGQWLIWFDTPEALRAINAQGELTLHNIQGFNGKSVYLRCIFGIGGLIGIALNRSAQARPIAAPVILLPRLLTITLLAVPDAYLDYGTIQPRLDYVFRVCSEFTEMLIGLAGLLYVALNWRRLEAMGHPAVRMSRSEAGLAPQSS